jgi:ketosteroid isomerase-like protein
MDDAGDEVVDRYWKAMADEDMQTAADLYNDDAIQEWPQSGERVVGRKNIMAINENYPGLPRVTIRRVVGSGDLRVSEVTLDYGGDRYEVVSILELRDGKIARETDYFAAPFEAPEWRSQWVEKM